MSPNSSSSRSSPHLFPAGAPLSQQRSNSPLSGPPQGGGPLSFRPGLQMGGPQHGRGSPPVTSPRGPMDGRGMPPGQRDPRTGPPGPGPRDGQPPYHHRGPPPGARRTPPPQNMQRPPPMQAGSPPINRKPLPPRTMSLQRHDSDNTPSQRPPSPRNVDEAPSLPVHNLRRQNSGRSAVSSHNDDASSVASPDYASTRHSTDTQEERERIDRTDRPRAGVLKTIGADSLGSGSGTGLDSQGYNIPDVNFGPTINYGAIKNNGPNANPPSNLRHHEQGNALGTGRKSPGPGPSYTHFRQESDDTIRRSMAWQPGAAIVDSGDAALTPEQFVQQRAAAAATPVYVHQRNPSANTLTEFRAGTPVSPHKRNHSRRNSADLLSSGRPLSQGTMAALSGGEVSSSLSAREQEHVARMTGSPLLTLNAKKPTPQPEAGLVGAIHARERERAQMKAGIGGQAVAQAIDQRTREQNQHAQRAAQAAYAQQQQQQAQMAAQQGYGMMGGGYQQAPGYGVPSHRPQMPSHGSFNGAGQYGQGGGWNQQMPPNRPSPLHSQSYGPGMQQGQPQSPGFQPPPQGQYTPPSGPRPGTPGRMQYQGQAF